GSRRGNEADHCARWPGHPPPYFGGYGARDLQGRSELLRNPGIGQLDTGLKIKFRAPPDRANALVAEIAGLNSDRTSDRFDFNFLSRHRCHGIDQLPDRHVLRTADIHSTFEVR